MSAAFGFASEIVAAQLLMMVRLTLRISNVTGDKARSRDLPSTYL
jgi:hypothetical protein